MRFLLFGTLTACRNYAKDHDFQHNQWVHADERMRVMGLNPANHEAIIVGPTLNESSVEALKEWFSRMRMHGAIPNGR